MKRLIALLSILYASSFAIHTLAQKPRGRIENVTDYSNIPSQATLPNIRHIGSRATAPLPSMGSPKVPVILVQFDDLKFTVAETEELVNQNYTDFFNAGPGVQPGAKGAESYSSVREYFRYQSKDQFTPQFTVIGPVTLSQGYAYYGKNSGNSKDTGISTFYSEACRLAVQQDGISWNDFDNNADGRVDLVFFIYAGEGENGCDDPNTIWPKESTSSISITYDNTKITFGAYGCTNELYGGRQDGIGTIIHELGHGLGLPDFYDTRGSAFGLDYWDIMDSGCYQISGHQPCCMSAYELDFMGWRPLVTLSPDSTYTLTLHPLETGGTAYKVINPANTDEYFILENRQNIDYDQNFGWVAKSFRTDYGYNHGLLITHVDYLASSWSSNSVNTNASHQRISPVPADGQLLSSYSGYTAAWAQSMHGDLYPGDAGVTEMSSYKVFKGRHLGRAIRNIQETAEGNITLDVTTPSYEEKAQTGNVNITEIKTLLNYYLTGQKSQP